MAQRYNPRTGTYSRGAAAYGPGGARGVAQAYNPRTGTYAQTRQSSNVYGNWGSTQVQRGDQWASTAHYTNNRTGNTTRVGTGSGGNMYAGRDGNVYKNTGDGWQKYGGDGNWNDVQRPTDAQKQQARDRAQSSGWDSSTASQVQRDSAARAEGQQRTADQSRMQSSGGASRSGSYRAGGGASRGGGGRRR
jgi:hypothetical protein